MIQAYIAPLFAPPGDVAWTGDRVTFSNTHSGANPFTSELHNPEAWGVWTSTSSVKLVFKAATDLLDGKIRLAVRLPPEKAWTSRWPVFVSLDGVEVLERDLAPGSRKVLAFKPPGGLRAGSTHTLEIRISHTVRAPGGDPRNLGVGLDYMEYCNTLHPCSPWG